MGSHLDEAEAHKQAEAINKQYPGFQASVWSPLPGRRYYPVVLGGEVTRQEAEELKRRALAAGLPRDIFLWQHPKR